MASLCGTWTKRKKIWNFSLRFFLYIFFGKNKQNKQLSEFRGVGKQLKQDNRWRKVFGLPRRRRRKNTTRHGRLEATSRGSRQYSYIKLRNSERKSKELGALGIFLSFFFFFFFFVGLLLFFFCFFFFFFLLLGCCCCCFPSSDVLVSCLLLMLYTAIVPSLFFSQHGVGKRASPGRQVQYSRRNMWIRQCQNKQKHRL